MTTEPTTTNDLITFGCEPIDTALSAPVFSAFNGGDDGVLPLLRGTVSVEHGARVSETGRLAYATFFAAEGLRSILFVALF